MFKVRSSESGVERCEATLIDTWLTRHAAVMLVSGGIAAASSTALPIGLAGMLSFAYFWHVHRRVLAKLRPHGGWPNLLTAVRLLLVAAAAVLLTGLSPYWALLVFASNVALDGADGHVARRTGQATRFGAVFDREADAFFVLVAYAYFLVTHAAAAWILVPGLLPYAFRLVARGTGNSSANERRERLAVRLAGANYGVLLVAIVATAGPQQVLLMLSTGIVALSFFFSFRNLCRDEYSLS